MISPFVVEHIAPGIVRESSSDGQLVIFNTSDGSAQTIERWAENVKATLLAWPHHQRCRMLHDLHKSGFTTFDKLMQTKFDEIAQSRPDLERCVAIVLPDEDSASIARLSARMREYRTPYPHLVHWEIFATRREAIKWILALCLQPNVTE